MAKKKNYWYVIVMTNNGAVFVTGTGNHHTATWNRKEKPREFGKEYAEEIAFGLTLNGHLAYAVETRYEVTTQPYRYNEGNFYWRRKKVKNDT